MGGSSSLYSFGSALSIHCYCYYYCYFRHILQHPAAAAAGYQWKRRLVQSVTTAVRDDSGRVLIVVVRSARKRPFAVVVNCVMNETTVIIGFVTGTRVVFSRTFRRSAFCLLREYMIHPIWYYRVFYYYVRISPDFFFLLSTSTSLPSFGFTISVRTLAFARSIC